MTMLISLFLALVCLLAIALQRTYADVPVKELKRRARDGDDLAGALFRAAAYGSSLRTVLWVLIGLSASGFFVFVARSNPTWLALVMCGILVWLGFVWLPASRTTAIGQRLAAVIAPAMAKIMEYLHGPISRVVNFIGRHRPVHIHTGMYERADLLDLIDKQQVQTDNRIEQAELEIARHALTFGDKIVRDIMTPRRAVKMVSADDDFGPVLLSELHDSGHSRFPVYDDGQEDNIVGILFLRDLVNSKSRGKAKNLVKSKALYLHEEQSLYEGLQAVLKTRQHMYIVVNSFEEYVGIITMEDIMEEIVGKQILDEFDQYEDIRAVTARAAAKEHQEHVSEQKTSTEKTEVVE